MEEWGITFDDEELLYDSKHYENLGYTISLDAYNAYDDKGNKIEGKYIEVRKKEWDEHEKDKSRE